MKTLFQLLAPSLLLFTSTTAALADDPMPVAPDCGAEVRQQRADAQEAGSPMTRRQMVAALARCRNEHLEARLAWQERRIAALTSEIATLNLRIDAQNRILDENNQVIAFIQAIDGQLTIQRELQAETSASRARQAAMLAEAERILQGLARQ